METESNAQFSSVQAEVSNCAAVDESELKAAGV